MMYFWAFGMPLAAVTEHGAEGSAHGQMLGGRSRHEETEHGAEHGTETTKTEGAHAETTAPVETSSPAVPPEQGK